MTTVLRIPKALMSDIQRDMARPHAFAAERIGFAHARAGRLQNGEWTVHLTGYTAVSDEHYVDDPRSGARIDSAAIRAAMQHVLSSREGLFHVHKHPFEGYPELSRMDRREIPRLVESFRHVDADLPHGILLLSPDAMRTWVWLPGSHEAVEPDRNVVVGSPMVFDFRTKHA